MARKSASANAVTETANSEAPTNALTTTQAGGVPAFMNEVDMTGKGVSNDAADKLIPMARVLQPLSPQVMNGNPAQIVGALAGDILIKNAPKPLIKGAAGIMFQSCFFHKDVVEWKPRGQGGGGGGGFVKRWDYETAEEVPDAEERPDPRDPSKKIWVNKTSGNWLVETRYHVGYIITPDDAPMPCYIPFSSTGHSVSKTWMFNMSLKRINGKNADCFAVYYLLKTKQRTRGDQTWFVFDPMDAGPPDASGQPTTFWVPTKADYDRGLELAKALEAGEVGLAAAEDDEPTNGGAAQGSQGDSF